MQFYFPTPGDVFFLQEDFKLKLTTGMYRKNVGDNKGEHKFNTSYYTGTNRHKNITHDKDGAILTLPKGTKLVLKTYEARNRIEYTRWISRKNFVSFNVYHPSFKGLEFKTVPRISLDIFAQDLEQLSQMKITKQED